MKLKNVSIQFPWNSLFLPFFLTFHSQVISLQTLLGQTSPMPWVKGLKKLFSIIVSISFSSAISHCRVPYIYTYTYIYTSCVLSERGAYLVNLSVTELHLIWQVHNPLQCMYRENLLNFPLCKVGTYLRQFNPPKKI